MTQRAMLTGFSLCSLQMNSKVNSVCFLTNHDNPLESKRVRFDQQTYSQELLIKDLLLYSIVITIG